MHNYFCFLTHSCSNVRKCRYMFIFLKIYSERHEFTSTYELSRSITEDTDCYSSCDIYACACVVVLYRLGQSSHLQQLPWSKTSAQCFDPHSFFSYGVYELLYPGNWGLSIPDSKVHGANMGPTWVLSAPDGPHVGPTNLAIRDVKHIQI